VGGGVRAVKLFLSSMKWWMYCTSCLGKLEVHDAVKHSLSGILDRPHSDKFSKSLRPSPSLGNDRRDGGVLVWVNPGVSQESSLMEGG